MASKFPESEVLHDNLINNNSDNDNDLSVSARAVIVNFTGRSLLYGPLNFKFPFPRAWLTSEV